MFRYKQEIKMATNDPLLSNLQATGYLNYTPPVQIGGAGAGPAVYDGGTTYQAPAYDAGQVQIYDQGIGNLQSAYNNVDPSYSSGVAGLNTQTADALKVLQGNYGQAEQSYNQNKQGVATGYVGQKNTIGENAGGTLSGLQRLLGSRGAGGGALSKFLPGEIARLASRQKNDVSQTFSQNNQNLDQNWGQFGLNYGNEVNKVNSQKESGLQSLASQRDQSKASLLQQIGALVASKTAYMGGNGASAAQSYYDQANGLLSNLARYSTPSINYNPQTYSAPSLAEYNQNPAITGSLAGQTSGTPDWISPALAGLLGKKQTVGA